jgi:hypothetical protein
MQTHRCASRRPTTQRLQATTQKQR